MLVFIGILILLVLLGAGLFVKRIILAIIGLSIIGLVVTLITWGTSNNTLTPKEQEKLIKENKHNEDFAKMLEGR